MIVRGEVKFAWEVMLKHRAQPLLAQALQCTYVMSKHPSQERLYHSKPDAMLKS